jgi:hypothetical protein
MAVLSMRTSPLSSARVRSRQACEPCANVKNYVTLDVDITPAENWQVRTSATIDLATANTPTGPLNP